MNRSFYLVAIAFIMLAGCSDTGFKKTKSGLEYKIVSGNGDKKIMYGNSVEFRAHGFYKDSLLATPYDSISQYFDVDSTRLPAEYVQIFKQAKEGDSIVTRILVDTILKNGGPVPAYAKKGNYISFQFRILKIITDPSAANALRNASMAKMMHIDSLAAIKQKVIDDKLLSDLIAKQKINAVKIPTGVYVEIQNPGEGVQIDSGKIVTVNYKGMSLDGKIFDQSYDAVSGKPTKPFTFMVGQQGAIQGLADGVKLFKKGGVGRLFIPSGMGYGAHGNPPVIAPNQSLLFEIQIVDVNTPDEYRKKMTEQNKNTPQQQNGQPQQPQTPNK